MTEAIPGCVTSFPPQIRQAAGNAVKRASDNLVKAAQKAAAFEDEENATVVVKERMVGGIAQVRGPSPGGAGVGPEGVPTG